MELNKRQIDWDRVDRACEEFADRNPRAAIKGREVGNGTVDYELSKSFDCVEFLGKCPLPYRIELYTMAKGRGYSIDRDGLVKKVATVEGPKYIPCRNAKEFIAGLNMPWTEPRMRELGTLYPNDEPELKVPITPDELRAWRDQCLWIDTKCGGEPHQFTARPAQKDDVFFTRIVWTIYEYGYDSNYKGRSWRYLDLEPRRWAVGGERSIH